MTAGVFFVVHFIASFAKITRKDCEIWYFVQGAGDCKVQSLRKTSTEWICRTWLFTTTPASAAMILLVTKFFKIRLMAGLIRISANTNRINGIFRLDKFLLVYILKLFWKTNLFAFLNEPETKLFRACSFLKTLWIFTPAIMQFRSVQMLEFYFTRAFALFSKLKIWKFCKQLLSLAVIAVEKHIRVDKIYSVAIF